VKLATDVEEWMYEPGATKVDYENKLTAISNLVGPMDERVHEMDLRESLDESVGESLTDIRKTIGVLEKTMPWVNASKVEALSKKLADFEEWWGKKKESQAQLPLHESPAYMVKEVKEKIGKVEKEADKLKNIKKPKEPKAKAAKDDKKAAKKSDEPALPADVPATEAELADVRKRKVEAVEKEDFDTAHSLKSREALLSKHLESLKADKADKTEL